MTDLEATARMRILVTGATGFIGRHAVAAAVASGHDVHGLARHEPLQPVGSVEYHVADILEDPGGARRVINDIRPTHLLHLAWYAEPGLYWTSALNFRWVAASLELAAAFAAAGGARFIGAGSCAEYEWTDRVLTETSPLGPASPYGTCKCSLRVLLESWSAVVGVSLAWARIFFLYGPGEPPERLVSSVCRALLRGDRVACTEGSQRRDFLFAPDVGAALVKLAESSASGAVNVGSGRAVAVRDLAIEIGRQTGRSNLLDFGAVRPREEAPVVQADVTRLRVEVGWQPTYDLRTGIARTIAWWQTRPDSSGRLL